jgi:lipid A oxidase
MRAAAVVLALGAATTAGAATAADLELSVYGGRQEAAPSGVSGSDAVLGPFAFRVAWQGRSFEAPPHYGLRATWWRGNGWGLGVEVNHVKVYAPAATRAAQGFSRLELTDGLNLVTLNVMREFRPVGRLQPYLGAGAGAAIPHVDVTTPGGRTFGYQVTGPAVVWMAGARLPLDDRWSVFGEYKGSRSWNTADLTGGGRLETDITTHALNLGLSFRF